MRRLLLVAAIALISNFAEAKEAAYNYTLHCSGCHRSGGVSPFLSRVPQLKDKVGYLVRDRESRRYFANVPGIMNSGLNTEDTAALLNWLIAKYGGKSTPASWTPFSAIEIAELRKAAPNDIIAYRRQVSARLASEGFTIAPYPQ